MGLRFPKQALADWRPLLIFFMASTTTREVMAAMKAKKPLLASFLAGWVRNKLAPKKTRLHWEVIHWSTVTTKTWSQS